MAEPGCRPWKCSTAAGRRRRACDGRGLLIAGEKRAGKTSLLVYLLRESGAAYVSNDRVLRASVDAATVRGMPTIVSLRADGLAFFAGLEARIVNRSYYYQRTLAEAAEHRRPTRPWPDGKFGVSPAQLCTPFGRRAASGVYSARAGVSAPHRDANAGGLRDLPRSEAEARLRGALLSSGLAK